MICFKCSRAFDPHEGSKRVCVDCYVLKGSRYAEAARKRKTYLKERYGMEPEDYEHMLIAQDGGCAICGDDNKLVVDHDHSTLSVRGLLCYRCNSGLGFFKDDTSYLLRAIEYLDRGFRTHEVDLQVAGNKSLVSQPV